MPTSTICAFSNAARVVRSERTSKSSSRLVFPFAARFVTTTVSPSFCRRRRAWRPTHPRRDGSPSPVVSESPRATIFQTFGFVDALRLGVAGAAAASKAASAMTATTTSMCQRKYENMMLLSFRSEHAAASFLRSAGQGGSRSRPHLTPLPMDALTLEAGQRDALSTPRCRIVPRTSVRLRPDRVNGSRRTPRASTGLPGRRQTWNLAPRVGDARARAVAMSRIEVSMRVRTRRAPRA
jgi:hypothetical protein